MLINVIVEACHRLPNQGQRPRANIKVETQHQFNLNTALQFINLPASTESKSTWHAD